MGKEKEKFFASSLATLLVTGLAPAHPCLGVEGQPRELPARREGRCDFTTRPVYL
jgi:hypothetical protein